MTTQAASAPRQDAAAGTLVAEQNGTVSLGGMPLLLAPKEQAVLHLLLRSWPSAVSKDEFAQYIWQAQDMSDASLARCVAQLRQRVPAAAGVSIHAVYGRGYRLAFAGAPVVASADASTPASHPRLMLAAMAAPRQVEALIQARQWTQQRTESSLRRAQDLLGGLLLEAPSYVAAQLGYAECLSATVTCGLRVPRALLENSLEQLQTLADRAQSLPGLHAEIAHLLDCLWRFDEARAAHDLALRTSPNDVETHGYWGWHLLATGQALQATQALQQAIRLNPFSINLHLLAARAFNASGDTAACLEQGRQAVALYPESIAARVTLLGSQAYAQPDPALAEAAGALQIESPGWAFAPSTLAYVFARCGDFAHAQSLIDASQNRPAGERINFVAALHALGQTRQAMDCLQAAAQEGCGHLPLLLQLAESRALLSHIDMPAVLATMDRQHANRTNLLVS